MSSGKRRDEMGWGGNARGERHASAAGDDRREPRRSWPLLRCPGAQLSRQGTLHETILYANRDLHERRLTRRNSPGRSKETCATQKRPTYTPKETWKAGSRPHCHPRGLSPFAGSAWVCFLALLHPTHRIRVSMVRAKARVRQGREEGEGERRARARGAQYTSAIYSSDAQGVHKTNINTHKRS